MEVSAILYEQHIINQQISYFILREEYENERGYVTEGLKEVGAWIKDKVDKFIKLIKSWFGKIWNFLTKTVPAAISKLVNNILVFLHLKKKPVVVNENKIQEKNKGKVKEACKKANKANAVIQAAEANDASIPKISSPTTSPEEKENTSSPAEEEKKENDNSKPIISQETLKKAEAVKQEAVNVLADVAATSVEIEEKKEVQLAISAIKENKQVITSSQEKESSGYLKGSCIKIGDAFKYLDCCEQAVEQLGRSFKDLKTTKTIIRNDSLNKVDITDDTAKYAQDQFTNFKSYAEIKKSLGANKYSKYKVKTVQRLLSDDVAKYAKDADARSKKIEKINLKATVQSMVDTLEKSKEEFTNNGSDKSVKKLNVIMNYYKHYLKEAGDSVADASNVACGIVKQLNLFLHTADAA